MKINEKLEYVEFALMGSAILVITLLLIANVVSRVAGANIAYAEEVSQWLIIANTFVGLSNNARKGKHIVMSALFDALPVKGKKTFLFISNLVSCIALIYLGRLSITYVQSVYRMSRVSGTLMVPMWIPYSMVPLGFFLAALQYAIIFYQNITDPTRVITSVQSLDTNKRGDQVEIDGVVINALIDENGELLGERDNQKEGGDHQ